MKGYDFVVFTDHSALIWLLSNKTLSVTGTLDHSSSSTLMLQYITSKVKIVSIRFDKKYEESVKTLEE